MTKYRVTRTNVRSESQVVEAESEDDAEELAQDNEEGFEPCINSDDPGEWEYEVKQN